MFRLSVIILALMISFSSVYAEGFKIVFMADLVASSNPSNPGNWANNNEWLDEIQNWGATGINIVVPRWAFEPQLGSFDKGVFANFGRALNNISGRGLDIYIRLSMGEFHNNWRGPSIGGSASNGYTLDDVHQTSDGNGGTIMMDNYLPGGKGKPILNITSTRSRNDLLRFVSEVLKFVDQQGASVKQRIKLIVPALSPDDETEYPSAISGPNGWGYLSGYSNPEIQEFHKYLNNKYNGSITNLKNTWGDIPYYSIDEIDPRASLFNWQRNGNKYTYEEGRKDLIDFRNKQLKRFIDDCALLVHRMGYKMGVQFGSINDAGVEYRGTSDYLSLLENTDHFILGDIPEYVEKGGFANDLAKKACDYWNSKKNRTADPLRFSTESNWPGYASDKFNDDKLVNNWDVQLENYYNSGAEGIFIAHWGTLQHDIAPRLVAKKMNLPGVKPLPEAYTKWRSILNKIKEKEVK